MTHPESFERVWSGSFHEVRKRTSRRYVVVATIEGGESTEVGEFISRRRAIRQAKRLDSRLLVRSQVETGRHRRLVFGLRLTGIAGRLALVVAFIISALIAAC
jgi:tetrahydromethanopterin S-methyltransferase subunit F